MRNLTFILFALIVASLLSLRPVGIGADTEKYIYLYYEAQGSWVFVDVFFNLVAYVGGVFSLPYHFMFIVYFFITIVFYWKICELVGINFIILMLVLAPLLAQLHWTNQIRVGAAIPACIYGGLVSRENVKLGLLVVILGILIHFSSILIAALFLRRSVMLMFGLLTLIAIAVLAFFGGSFLTNVYDYFFIKLEYYLDMQSNREFSSEVRLYLNILIASSFAMVTIGKRKLFFGDLKYINSLMLLLLIYLGLPNQTMAYRISEIFLVPCFIYVISKLKIPKSRGMANEGS